MASGRRPEEWIGTKVSFGIKQDGDWTIVDGLEIDDFSRGRIDKSTAELADERKAVTELGLI